MLSKLEYIISKIIKKLHLRAIKNCKIHKSSKVCSGSHLVNVSIGKHSDVGYDCSIVNTEIGAFCSLGANIVIGGANHTVDWASTSPVFNENKDHLTKKFSNHKFNLDNHTSIGNDVWIGNSVLIKANLKIGDGVVIGMGSVVTKDIPSYEIWAGNPAKFIKKRFNDDVKKEMLLMSWWRWNDKKIALYAPYFNDVSKLIEYYKLNNKELLK